VAPLPPPLYPLRSMRSQSLLRHHARLHAGIKPVSAFVCK
jgi:hypothetical protein